MTDEKKPDTRCPVCSAEFVGDDLQDDTDRCPSCGYAGNPYDPSEDVTLTLNWLDLRCLVQWAENYILSNKGEQDWERYWEALKERIRKHRPEASAGLTLFEEMDQLRLMGFDVIMYDVPPEGESPFDQPD